MNSFTFLFNSIIFYYSEMVLLSVSGIPAVHVVNLYCLLLYKLQVADLPLIVRTKAGMTFGAESITESLRRTRQLMVQGRTQLALLLLFPICITGI